MFQSRTWFSVNSICVASLFQDVVTQSLQLFKLLTLLVLNAVQLQLSTSWSPEACAACLHNTPILDISAQRCLSTKQLIPSRPPCLKWSQYLLFMNERISALHCNSGSTVIRLSLLTWNICGFAFPLTSASGFWWHVMTLGRPKTKKIWEQFHSMRVVFRCLRFIMMNAGISDLSFYQKGSSKHVMLQEISVFWKLHFLILHFKRSHK